MNNHAILNAISQGLRFPVFALDRDYRYTHFNAAHAAIMKDIYGADVQIGHALADYLTPADWEIIRQSLDRASQGKMVTTTGAIGAEEQNHRKFEVIHRPVTDDAGAVVGVAVIAQELTDRELALEALRQSESQFRGLIENSSDAIALLAPDGTVLYDSPSAPGLLGYGPEEWIGKSAFALIHPEDLPGVGRILEELAHKPGEHTNHTFRLRHKSGRWLWIEATATNLLAEPAIRAIVINYRDESERIRAERQLRESEARLRGVWETTSDAMALSDPEGVLLAVNPAFVKLYGYSAEELIGQLFSIIFPEEARTEAITAYQIMFGGEATPAPIESVMRRADGSERVVELQATFLTSSGKRTMMLSTIRDITERKAAEEALRQSNRQLEETLEELRRTQTQLVRHERLAAVGQLAAGIAHDFNNILSVILLQIQLALRTQELAPRLRDRLTAVAQQAGRAADLVQQILDFSRSAVLQTLPLDVWDFFQEQVELLRRTIPERIQIRLGGEVEGATLHADPTRLQQLLSNLAINARDAMPDGGELAIHLAVTTHRASDPAPMSPAEESAPGGSWLRVTVRDTGCGVPASVMPHIFEPFFTTKEPGQGTGLGLAQVYGIVKQHNGYIEVQSQPGQGTTFTIDLPVVDGAPVWPGAPLPDAPLPDVMPLGRGETILVVEDDPGLRNVLVDTLRSLNYAPLTARDGRDALAQLDAPEHDIALVLSDLTMPNMGGHALFQDMQKRGRHAPVVILSGHPVARDLEAMVAQGLAGWLPKPPEIRRLARLLAQILDKGD